MNDCGSLPVMRLQKIQEMLSGMDEILAYRQIERTSYGPHLDLATTADSITHVHSQLQDLKVYLATALGSDGKAGAGDVEMADAK